MPSRAAISITVRNMGSSSFVLMIDDFIDSPAFLKFLCKAEEKSLYLHSQDFWCFHNRFQKIFLKPKHPLTYIAKNFDGLITGFENLFSNFSFYYLFGQNF